MAAIMPLVWLMASKKLFTTLKRFCWSLGGRASFTDNRTWTNLATNNCVLVPLQKWKRRFQITFSSQCLRDDTKSNNTIQRYLISPKLASLHLATLSSIKNVYKNPRLISRTNAVHNTHLSTPLWLSRRSPLTHKCLVSIWSCWMFSS